MRMLKKPQKKKSQDEELMEKKGGRGDE